MNRNEAPAGQFWGFLQHRRNIVSDTDDTLPIVEETATVRKRAVTTGRVTIKTETRLEEALADASLTREQVEVTRVPVDREILEPPPVRTEGDVTIIPVFEERLVVEKRLVLVEEIRVRRTTLSEDVSIPIPLRRQHVVVERSGGNPTTPSEEDQDERDQSGN